MKKFLSIILVSIMIISSVVPAFAESISITEAGNILEDLNILKGSSSGDLMLNSNFKRQDMVVLMSRLYSEEDKAKTHPAIENFKDIRDKFYLPYISWSYNKNLIKGMTNTRFGFGEFVTVKQFQTVLLRVLGYNTEADNWDKVSDHAKEIGIMEGVDATPNSEAKRGVMAQMTVNALRLNLKNSDKTLAEKLDLNLPNFKVDNKYTIENDKLTIKGTIKNAKKASITLTPDSTKEKAIEKTLELNKDGEFTVVFENLLSGEYTYTFNIDGKKSDSTKVKIDNIPFKLVDIKADNLREIHLNFTNPVDSRTALFTSNYSTTAGEIGSVRLENNDKTVVLSLTGNKTMVNNREYKINVQSISSKSNKSLEIKNETFKAYDNASPEIKEVKALGNQRIKITLSEPVKFPSVSNFKIDNKNFSGRVQNNDNIITLIYSSSQKLDEGKYTLSISNLEDYAGYKATTVEKDFEVVKDSSSPVIIDSSATFEEVIVVFDKEIDENSITKNDVYWTYNSRKRTPDKLIVEDNKLRIIFSGSNSLSDSETTIYIDTVKDYFGNTLRNQEVKVKPLVDDTEPRVVAVELSSDGRSIRVLYSKNVKGYDTGNYKITDSNNRNVYIRTIDGTGRDYNIVLGSQLPQGKNTLEIKDIEDTSSSKNKMRTYTTDLDMKDNTEPKLLGHSGKDNEIVLMFDKEMNLETVTDPSNYLINLNGRTIYLPNDTNFEPVLNNKTIHIKLPSRIDGSSVSVGPNGTIKEMQTTSLKGENGVLMKPTTLKFTSNTQGEAVMKEAVLVEPEIIEVKFDQPITTAYRDDFYISGYNIYDVKTSDSNTVKVYIDGKRDSTNISGTLEVVRHNDIKTFLNTGAASSRISIKDKLAPRIENFNYLEKSGRTIYLPFTENLDSELGSRYSRDLIVERQGYGEITSFTTRVSGNKIEITISDDKTNDEYRVRLVDRPSLISDTSGNVVEYDGVDYYTRHY